MLLSISLIMEGMIAEKFWPKAVARVATVDPFESA